MYLSKNEQNELIEQYNECDGGLICVSEDELKDGIEYYMDKEECMNMIDTNFSTDDSIIHLTDNNYNTQYLEVYRTKDDEPSDIYYIICPSKAEKEYKQWFKDLIKYIQIKETLKDYKDLVESNGELNHMADSGYKYEDMYHYGYLEWLNALCVKYNIEFDTNKIEWEWCNYVHSKQRELELKLEEKLGLR